MTLSVAIERLSHAADLPLPSYATAGSAGLDLRAAVENTLKLAPKARALIPTGIRIALDAGYEAQIRPRSGLAIRDGLTVLNAPGTIDADYRGEIGVILINLGEGTATLSRGDRIAQLVVAPVVQVVWRETTVGKTARGTGGFGSTGIDAR